VVKIQNQRVFAVIEFLSPLLVPGFNLLYPIFIRDFRLPFLVTPIVKIFEQSYLFRFLQGRRVLSETSGEDFLRVVILFERS
jgi:hypothetical protein